MIGTEEKYPHSLPLTIPDVAGELKFSRKRWRSSPPPMPARGRVRLNRRARALDACVVPSLDRERAQKDGSRQIGWRSTEIVQQQPGRGRQNSVAPTFNLRIFAFQLYHFCLYGLPLLPGETSLSETKPYARLRLSLTARCVTA